MLPISKLYLKKSLRYSVFWLLFFCCLALAGCKNLFYVKSELASLQDKQIRLVAIDINTVEQKVKTKLDDSDEDKQKPDFFIDYPVSDSLQKELFLALIEEFNSNDAGVALQPLSLSDALEVLKENKKRTTALQAADIPTENMIIGAEGNPSKIHYYGKEMVFFSAKAPSSQLSAETAPLFKADLLVHLTLTVDTWSQSVKGVLRVFEGEMGKLIWFEEINFKSSYIAADSESPYRKNNSAFQWQLDKESNHFNEMKKVYGDLGRGMAIEFKESVKRF